MGRRSLVPVLTAALLLLSGCSHVSYLWQAAKGQAALYNRERKLDEVLDDPSVDEETKGRLRVVKDMKQFVETELGVKATGNYTTYVDLKRPYVVWVVTAAPPFELKEKTWSFPIVGEVPYLGFFNEEAAKSWAEDLKEEGFDTYVRGAPAYSTLGYLRDPILSSMIFVKGKTPVSDAYIANLVFHETTHSHLYIASDTSFNEAAASFIGEYGERHFLVKRFGEKSPEVKRWAERRKERRAAGESLRKFADELKEFYAKTIETPLELRLAGKQSLFERFDRHYENNAAVLGHLAYEDDQPLFDSIFEKCGSDVRRSFDYLRRFGDAFDKFRNKDERAKKALERWDQPC